MVPPNAVPGLHSSKAPRGAGCRGKETEPLTAFHLIRARGQDHPAQAVRGLEE